MKDFDMTSTCGRTLAPRTESACARRAAGAGRIVRRSLSAAVLTLLTVAGTASAQAPDRSEPPPVGPAPDLVLPALQEFTLDNGLRVLLMEKHDVPLVQLNLLIGAGTARDDQGEPGVASMTAAMLDEGAAGRAALEIADAFEMLGARFGIGAGTHTASMSLRAPSQRIDDALEIAADVVLRPDFPDAELDRLRAERLTSLVRRYDEPNAIAGALFGQTLYGTGHPYGREDAGTAASLRAMSTADLRAFHERFYRPNNVTAIIVGDIDRAAAERMLERAFGSWERADVPEEVIPAAGQVSGRTIYLVDKPGSAQSIVQLGRIGVPRSTEDYFALEVMNVVLGGSFTSRLNQNLREDKGYSYGARSGFSWLPAAGPWSASAAVQTQSTGPAIAEFMKELRGMHEPIPAEEVERARNFLAMRYPAGFQSVAGIAARLGDMVQYRLPADFFNRYVTNVLAVTDAEVERVAREYIDPENLAIFVVGDREVIEQQVRDLGLGEIRFLEVTDVFGPMPSLDN
ncbi:MAG TPA: pitrilysin family protein [Longimicrobiales bacterium]|nr:pitrilysin family protein [Longimicrobiales bacterium]